MLPETRATSYAHDPALGTVVVYSKPGASPDLHGDLPATLLLDGSGHLVGLDVAPESPNRLVVMLGPHESVASTTSARVHVEGGGRTVTLHGSAARSITAGANPYVF
jgi:hypothetical protein